METNSGIAAEDAALDLALWVRENYPRAYAARDAITHLKLQKLVFFAYGAAAAFELDEDVGTIDFRAWKHGPVSPSVYCTYKRFAGDPIPSPDTIASVTYDGATARVLKDALHIYGALDAWSLRQQSHLEAPWTQSYQSEDDRISSRALRVHFRAKFRSDTVRLPEYLGNFGTFALDGIPVPEFRSFHDMAETIRAARG